MGYGFKEIYDLSPLSIKNLNDQLYMLWKKVMGGISETDILDGESEKIVERGIQNIEIGVGRVAGTNLVKNGRGNFGTEGFTVTSPGSLTATEDVDLNQSVLSASGEFVQSGIALTPGETYCFGFMLDTNNADVAVGVYCQLPNSIATARDIAALEQTINTSTYEKQEFKFTAQSGIKSCLVAFNGESAYQATDIQLKAGETFGEWTPHEGEVFASGIHISQQRVSISTPNADINILDPDDPDPDNPLISMSASSGGFNQILTQKIVMGGYELARFSDEPIALYVNPQHANASDANDGLNADAPCMTIAGALKKAGRLTNQTITIYLAAGTDYREPIRISGYQGTVIFDIYDGTTRPIIYGMGTQGVIVESCTMVVFQNINFYCFFSEVPDYDDTFCTSTAISYRWSNGRIENCRFYCHTTDYGLGVELVHSNVTLKNYVINDFKHVMVLKHLSRGLSKNGVGECSDNFIISGAMLLTSGNRPRYTTSLYTQLDSGFQSGSTMEAYAPPLTGVQTPYEYNYTVTFSGSWGDNTITTLNPANIRQGEDREGIIYTGVFGFNLTEMRAEMSGKTVKSAYLRLTRASDIYSVRNVHLWGCEKTAISGMVPEGSVSYDYGYVCTFMGGDETLEFGINPDIINDLLSEDAGTPKSLMVFDDWYSPLSLYGTDTVETQKPMLRICV